MEIETRMPRPPSRRARTMACLGVGIAMGVALAAFVWPGFLYCFDCALSSGPFETVNGHAYCYATVGLPSPSTHFYANYTEWGFAFEIFAPPTPGISGMTVTITEPSGAASSGGMNIGGPPRPGFTSTWLVPDNESGVAVLWNSENVSLLVER